MIFGQPTIVISHGKETTKTQCEGAEWILFAPGPGWLALSGTAFAGSQSCWQFRRYRRSFAQWPGRLVKSPGR